MAAGAFPASSGPAEIAAGVSPAGRPGGGSISPGAPAGGETGPGGGIPCSERPMPPPGCGIGGCGIAGDSSGSKPPGRYPGLLQRQGAEDNLLLFAMAADSLSALPSSYRQDSRNEFIVHQLRDLPGQEFLPAPGLISLTAI